MMLLPLSLKIVLSLCLLIARPAPAETPLVEDAELQRLGLRKFWEARLPLAPGDEIQEAHRVDEVLYVISRQGVLYALTAEEGLLRWVAPLTQEDYTIHPPTHVRQADGRGATVVVTTTETFLLDRFTGQTLLRFRPDFPIGGSAEVIGNVFLVGSTAGKFHALSLPVQRAPALSQLWEVAAGGPVTTRPVVFDRDKLLFASHGGQVYACLAGDKTLLWSYRAGGAITGNPVVDDNGAYVASADRSLYKLRLGNGTLEWRARFPRPLNTAPVVVSGTVYQYCDRDGLSALDAATGNPRWKLEQGHKLAAHSMVGDLVYTLDRRLEIIEPSTGESMGGMALPASLDVVVNPWDDAAYVLGQGGRVASIRLDDIPYLRRLQVLAAQRALNLPPEPDRPPDADAQTPRDADRRGRDPFRSRYDRNP